jgi:predicted nucleotidyltransferase
MKSLIESELRRIESKYGVRVLYAVESGSRAWGFASKDSDYDVRFLYVHPLAWYLSVEQQRDVIEEPIRNDLDLSGWDLRKALGLLRKSNPPLLEWLNSPVVYFQDDAFLGDFRRLASEHYQPEKVFLHYLHMAEGNFRSYLREEIVWIKKYFYVLRPILACRWIERGLGVVPMEFGRLAHGTLEDPTLRFSIADLVVRKQAGEELDRGPRIPAISDFIEAELPRLALSAPIKGDLPPVTPLNSFFRNTLQQAA